MKKLSTIVAAATIAASASLPAAAETNDPFVSTQAMEISPLIVIGGLTGIVGIAASVGENDSSSGTTD